MFPPPRFSGEKSDAGHSGHVVRIFGYCVPQWSWSGVLSARGFLFESVGLFFPDVCRILVNLQLLGVFGSGRDQGFEKLVLNAAWLENFLSFFFGHRREGGKKGCPFLSMQT